jgi:cytochrome c556
MRKRVRVAVVVGALAAAVGGAIIAEAQTGAAQAVQARKDLMRMNGRAIASMLPIMRNEQPWNQQTAIQAATSLRDDGTQIPTLFPPGSGPQAGIETGALPAIWERRTEFEALAGQLRQVGETLLAAAQANDEQAFRAGFPAAGRACGGCHTAFRAPQ